MAITFSQVCVGIFMVIAVGIVTGLFSYILDKDDWPLIGWMINTIGFGVCLTMLLYLTGVL